MASIDNVIKELRRPFTPEAMQFKIQSAGKGDKALIVCYIDARQVCERLNLVCPQQWNDAYREIVVGERLEGVQCTIGISPAGTGGYYVDRADVGVPEGGIGGLKAVYSDAFKRAGVKWGVGVAAYYTPKFYAKKSDLREYGNKFYMSDKVLNQARAAYAAWLEAEGIERFGEPLDMGDNVEAQGDVEVLPEGDPEVEPEPKPGPEQETVLGDLEPTGQSDDDQPKITPEKMRQSYKAYTLRADDEEKASQRFSLWLNSKGFSTEIAKQTQEQRREIKAFLDSDGEKS